MTYIIFLIQEKSKEDILFVDAELIETGAPLPCILELSILHVSSSERVIYTFYNHRICCKYSRLHPKYKKAFEFCQRNIHGLQRPNYETLKQVTRRGTYTKMKDILDCGITQYRYNDLSCFKVKEIITSLFAKTFKNVGKLCYKGGIFELRYFGDMCRIAGIDMLDLGRFDIATYIDHVSYVNACYENRHKRNLSQHSKKNWRRHCPQFEVMAFYDRYFECGQ